MFDRLKREIMGVGLVVAATIGAGTFALPYVFKTGGWITCLVYFLVLGGVVVFAHQLFLEVIAKTGDKKGILGLVRSAFGPAGFYFAFFIFQLGLVLTLVAYLVLGAGFMNLLFPGAFPMASLVWFWIIASFPIALSLKRFIGLEVGGAFFMAAVIAFIFFKGAGSFELGVGFSAARDYFFPFGAILFSLAGWTAVLPLYEGGGEKKFLSRGLIFGTAISVLIYLAFITGVLGSTDIVTPDTISGLSWPAWQIDLLALFGLFAIWTSYVPIGFEIKSSLEKDFKYSRTISFAAVVFVPLVLVLLGLSNFFEVVGLVGGVFLALQYVFIILVARKILGLKGWKGFLAVLISVVFSLAAIYELYYFFIG